MATRRHGAPQSADAASGTASQSTAETTSSGLRKDSVFYTAVASFRDKFRREMIPPAYSVWRHFGMINLVGGLCVLVTGYLAGGPRHMFTNPASLLLMFLGFCLSNYFEYYTHKYKLHAPFIHTRHSHTHHRFFTDRVMEFDSFRDAHAILFPQRAPFFFAGLVLFLSLLPMAIAGFQPGMAFACTLSTYYLSYEWMHLSYHSPPDSFLGSLPGVRYLREHHQIHHSQALMGKYNFNITWPFADWLFGTTYRGPLSGPGIPNVKAAPTEEAAKSDAELADVYKLTGSPTNATAPHSPASDPPRNVVDAFADPSLHTKDNLEAVVDVTKQAVQRCVIQ